MNINLINSTNLLNYFNNNSYTFSSITKKVSSLAIVAFGLYLIFCTFRCCYHNSWKKPEDGQNKAIDFFGYVSEGEFKDGKLNGHGKKEQIGIFEEGEFIDGVLNGQGKRNRFGEEAKGEFKDGKLNGQGERIITTFHGKSKREGEFKNDKLNGKGKLDFSGNLGSWEGEFEDNFLNGKGKILTSLCTAEGEFKNSRLQGQGKRTLHSTPAIIEEGEFDNNDLHGQGRRYCNGIVQTGQFEHGEFIG